MMKEIKKERNSNFELMRIISMLFIILYHTILHGHIIENTYNDGLKIIFELLQIMTIVHVNSFVIVSGYFQYNKQFKFEKILKLLLLALFYSLLIPFVFYKLHIINSISKLELIDIINPFNLSQYWFIKAYLILYMLSPFINILINNIDKTTYRKMLIVMFFAVPFLSVITNNIAIFNDHYFSLYNFVFYYCLGGYLRKYPIENSYYFKFCSKNLLRIILIILFFLSIFSKEILYIFASSIKNINTITNFISNTILNTRLSYLTLLTLIQTLSYFCLFSTINFKSKIVNDIGSKVFGIYLIHENYYVRPRIYTWLKIGTSSIYSYKFVIYIFLVVIFIFVISYIIDSLRCILLKIFKKFKIYKKLRNDYYKFKYSIYIK